jgi:putative NADH-flavin reductase
MMSTVAIIGASHGIGLETLRLALERGHVVRALARSADGIPVRHANLEKIAGSALSEPDVDRAVAGADAVITVLGTPPTLSPVHLFSDTARTVIRSMANNKVDRLIAVTGIGAGDSKGVGGLLYAQLLQPIFLGTIYEDKDREEAIIRESGLAWTIVRPGFLTRFPARGGYRVLTEPDEWEGGFITRADVADFLVKQIDDKAHVHETPLLID